MTLKILGAVAVGAAMLWSCAATSAPRNEYAAYTAGAAAARVNCGPPNRATIGTSTKVGDAVVTAKHVVTACRGRLPAVMQSGDFADYAILKAGSPGVCKDAEVGEAVLFAGYPATNAVTRKPLKEAFNRLEMDAGVVTRKDVKVVSLDSQLLTVKVVEGLTETTANTLRGGYSGGPVVSAVDGRVVGVTNAAATDSTLAYFTPITLICDQIRKELARE